MRGIFLVSIVTAMMVIGGVDGHSVGAAEQWGVCEVELHNDHAPQTIDAEFSATFVQGDRKISSPGFWDGGDSFKVRFSPPASGVWNYTTHSKHAALDGQTGSLTVDQPSNGNHGPVQVFDSYYLRYADGTAYHQFGTTCYAWVHQSESLQGQTLKSLSASPFNKIRFCVFPKSYVYNKNEPARFAFKKLADGTF